MNVQHLQETYPKLISYLEENGYSRSYINRLKREINRIISKAESQKWSSYTDVYLGYVQKGKTQTFLKEKHSLLGTIERFDINDQYPDGRQHKGIIDRGKYHLLEPEFKSIIDNYCAIEKERGKKDSSIYVESRNAAKFLFGLQQKGFDTLEKITEEAVLSAFVVPETGLTRSYSYKKSIAAVFKACIRQAPETFSRILAFFPTLRKTRKSIQYLMPEEVALFKQALSESKSPLSLRDKAIVALALYMGLRCCDIAELNLRSFDWSKDLIVISQQKTGVPLELPLNAIVGNAVYDYITLERPKNECEYIFISNHRPFGKLKRGTISCLAGRIMKALNIRLSEGNRRGFHIFRHHLATELLGNGIQRPIISKALGHTSPNSIDTYLSADFTHLKECALSVEKFPIAKGVFCDA